ncbi:MAG: hypothetical protein HYS86_01980 [Candidatus Chisholmbacteria bacterium]|nr:hypothetical protein [Candidatus Chisholmbacteria bacterium]
MSIVTPTLPAAAKAMVWQGSVWELRREKEGEKVRDGVRFGLTLKGK